MLSIVSISFSGLAYHYSYGSASLGFICGSLFTIMFLITFVEYQERKNSLLSVFERNKRRMEKILRRKREEELEEENR